VGSQLYGEGWVGLEASVAQKSSGQSKYLPDSALRKNGEQGEECLDTLSDCDELARVMDYAELAACVYDDFRCTSHMQQVSPDVLGSVLR